MLGDALFEFVQFGVGTVGLCIDRRPCKKFIKSLLHLRPYLRPDEIGTVFLDGHSGKEVVRSKLKGDGIGLYRAKRLIELNGGALVVHSGKEVEDYRGMLYYDNLFVLSIPL